MSYTSHISAEARSAIARLNGTQSRQFWTKRRINRAFELKADGFTQSDIASKMRCGIGSVSGMFYRQRKKRPNPNQGD